MLPSCDVYLATYKNKLNASDCIYAILIPCNFLSETFFRILCSYTNNRVYIPKTDILYVFINSSLNRVGHAQQNTITMKWPESKAAIKQKKNSHKTSESIFSVTPYIPTLIRCQSMHMIGVLNGDRDARACLDD